MIFAIKILVSILLIGSFLSAMVAMLMVIYHVGRLISSSMRTDISLPKKLIVQALPISVITPFVHNKGEKKMARSLFVWAFVLAASASTYILMEFIIDSYLAPPDTLY